VLQADPQCARSEQAVAVLPAQVQDQFLEGIPLNGSLGQAQEEPFNLPGGFVGVPDPYVLEAVQLFNRFEKGLLGVLVVPQGALQGGFVLYFLLLELHALQPAERLAF
jgi:hypothetical protein